MSTHFDDYDVPGSRTRKHAPVLAGGVAGNARLTAMTGVTLLGLLFIEGLTIPAIRVLLVPHIFVGFLIVPPLMLKLGSTGYRFVRYYTGEARYRAAGPPNPLLRLLAPLLILTIIVLIASGVMLVVAGPQPGRWPRQHLQAWLFWTVVAMNAGVIVVLWVRGGNVSDVHSAPGPGRDQFIGHRPAPSTLRGMVLYPPDRLRGARPYLVSRDSDWERVSHQSAGALLDGPVSGHAGTPFS